MSTFDTVFRWKQDCHVHSLFSDGMATIKEMAMAAATRGMEMVVIADHARGWSEGDGKRLIFFPTLERYEAYLRACFEAGKHTGIRVLPGLEIEVTLDGSFKLDSGIEEYANSHRGDLGTEVIIGSIHSESFNEDCIAGGVPVDQRREALLTNCLALIANNKVDVFAHPNQAFHGNFAADMTEAEIKAIVQAMTRERKLGHYIVLEINGKETPRYEQWSDDLYASGLLQKHDLRLFREHLQAGGKLVFGSDSHDSNAVADFHVAEALHLTEGDIWKY